MRISHTVEHLLPCERVPFLSGSKGSSETSRWCGFSVAFMGRRLFVDLIVPQRRPV